MALQFYNMMSCTGFDPSFMGGCSLAWVGLVISVFVIMFARKWLFEEALQAEFAFYIAIAVTVITYFIVVGISGNYKIATAASMLAGMAAGYFGPMAMGGGDGGGDGGEF